MKKFKFLGGINKPADLKKLNFEELNILAAEIRELMIEVVSKNGGHLASSLGTVELTLALYKVFDAPKDKIIWDVGHQAYAHKIITGRRNSFKTLRKYKGISGFLKPDESPYDIFAAGHTSTSVSAAMGFAKARDIMSEKYEVIAVIGDASIANGMALEAVNNIGHDKTDMIIVLVDNEMSISPSVGAMSNYLNRIISGKGYADLKKAVRTAIEKIPTIGAPAAHVIKHLEEGLRSMVSSGVLFEELGIRYTGPIDGHNIQLLCDTLGNIRKVQGPRILHVITKKGKGYAPAENNPTLFHGVGSFNKETGEAVKFAAKNPTYSSVFSNALLKEAADNQKIVAIVAAMIEGTNLSKFKDNYPLRFFDVGIAEEHAVTFAAGLAAAGLKPYVAIYSTFMQRSVDQIIHDCAMQNLPVVLVLDRAGLVGDDGPTHHGVFDIVFTRMIPNMTVITPSTADELELAVAYSALHDKGPVAIRFPRGESEREIRPYKNIRLGRSRIIQKGRDITLICAGPFLFKAVKAAEKLLKETGKTVEIIDARFIKPFDEKAFAESVRKTKRLITVEEGVIEGGFGQAVVSALLNKNIKFASKILGIPDEFIEQGEMEKLRKICGLDQNGIYLAMKRILEE